MKIIILAAGKGERLLPLTRNTPKPLLDMGNGRTLLEEQLLSIRRSEAIGEVALSIGYLGDQVEAKLEAHKSGDLQLRTIFNPFFGVSNNFMSMWLCKSEMLAGDAFMITNGDNLFSPDVFADFANSCGPGIWLACGPKKEFDFDDMRVHLDGEGNIAKVSKKLSLEESDAESPGLCLVRGERAKTLFLKHMENLARKPESLNVFWLEVFNELYRAGVTVKPWFFEASDKWQEMDFHADLEALRELLKVRPGLLDPPTTPPEE